MSTSTATTQMTNEDQVLLRRFLDDRSNEAFTRLVERHIGVVRAHAERLLRDSAQADDVTQAVFLLLAQKAGTLNTRMPLVGWLYTVTHYTCANARRMELRRKRFEQEAASMSSSSSEPVSSSDVEIHLDRILQKLPAYERDTLLLRYVHDYTPAEIAALTHTTEAATKKRLQRALQKIRQRFAVAGVTLPASFIPAPFLAGLPVPAHLAVTTVTTALAPSSAIAPAILHLAKGAMHMLLAAKMKLVAVAVLIVGITVGVGGILVGQGLVKEVPAPVAQATPVPTTMSPAAAPRSVAASMPATVAGMISGVVVDAGGKVVAGAFVSRIERHAPRYISTVVESVRTAADGSFSLKDLVTPDAGVQIVADLPGVGMCEPVDWGKVTHSIVLRFSRSMEVHFPLRDPAGKPPQNVLVYLKRVYFPSTGDEYPFAHVFELPKEICQRWSAPTDARGVATISGIPRQSMLKIDTDDERYAQIKPFLQITVNGDAEFTTELIALVDPCRILGTLTYVDTHLPVANTRVNTAGSETNNGVGYGETKTDSAGHFVLDRLAAGRYVVYGDSSGFPDYAIAAAIVSTSAAEPAKADLVMVHGGIATGVARDQSTGKLLADVYVSLYGPSRPKEAAACESQKTDAQGRYRFRVPPGEQYVYLSSEQPPAGYVIAGVKDITEKVAEGESVTHDFDFIPDTSPSISGTVVDDKDAPVPKATVLYDLAESQMNFSQSVVADLAGHFVIPRFKSRATLRARAGNLATFKATKVTFADDAIVLHVSPKPVFSVTVRVTDADGISVPNVTVSTGNMMGNFGAGGQPTPLNADGTVRFEKLSKDSTNYIEARAPGYLEEQKTLKPPAGDELTVRLILKKADTPISGTVRDSAGKPVANVDMGIMAEINDPSAKTDAKGRYEFLVPEGMKTAVYIRATGGGALNGQKGAEAGETDVDFVMPTGASGK